MDACIHCLCALLCIDSMPYVLKWFCFKNYLTYSPSLFQRSNSQTLRSRTDADVQYCDVDAVEMCIPVSCPQGSQVHFDN